MLMDLPDELQHLVLGFLQGKAISTLFTTTAGRRTMPSQGARSCICSNMMIQRVLVERLLLVYERLRRLTDDDTDSFGTCDVAAFLTRIAEQAKNYKQEQHRQQHAAADDDRASLSAAVLFLSSRLAVLDYFEQAAASHNPDRVGVIEYPMWFGSMSSQKRDTYSNDTNHCGIFAQALHLSLQKEEEKQQQQQQAEDDYNRNEGNTKIYIQLLTPFWDPIALHGFQRHCFSRSNRTVALERNGYMFRTVPPMGRVVLLPSQQAQQQKQQEQHHYCHSSSHEEESELLKGLSQSLIDSIVLTLRRPREDFSLVFCNGRQMHERSFLPSTPKLDPYSLKAQGSKEDLYFMFRHQNQEDDDIGNSENDDTAVIESGVHCILSLMRQRDIIHLRQAKTSQAMMTRSGPATARPVS